MNAYLRKVSLVVVILVALSFSVLSDPEALSGASIRSSQMQGRLFRDEKGQLSIYSEPLGKVVPVNDKRDVVSRMSKKVPRNKPEEEAFFNSKKRLILSNPYLGTEEKRRCIERMNEEISDIGNNVDGESQDDKILHTAQLNPTSNASTPVAASSKRFRGQSGPQYQGRNDGAGCNTIQGWAWDANTPTSTVSVDIYNGNTFIATTPANMYREDLLNALSSPNHGFSFLTPAALKDGAVHTINVKFSGTNTPLSDTSRTIQCTLPANLYGRHDGQGCNSMVGWAWDGNDPNGTVNVDIYDGTTLIGTVAATQYRQDLADNLGSPYHGFSFHPPASFRDGQPHTITVKFGGTNTNLPLDTPRTTSCTGSTLNYQGSHDTADCNWISGYAWDRNDNGGTINVAIYVDGNFLVVVPAQQAYPGIGSGYHGFKFAVPASVKNGQLHSIRVKYSGTTTDLSNTPITITCATNPASGSYEGVHDGADCSVISGWAWDWLNPNSPVNVDIFDGTTLLARVPANQFRQDLVDAGKGNGYHGFSLLSPASFQNGQEHSIRVKHAGTTTDLSNTPKTLTCSDPAPGDGWGFGNFYTSNFHFAYSYGSDIRFYILCPTVAGGNVSNSLYLTATNRTSRGVEAFVSYADGQHPFAFKVFDWARPDHWQVFLDYDQLSDYLTTITVGGNTYQALYVMNFTSATSGSPNQQGLWFNDVLLNNYRTGNPDWIYDYGYQSNLQEQQGSNPIYAYWGPIVETFQNTYNNVNPMGFADAIVCGGFEADYCGPLYPWNTNLVGPQLGFQVAYLDPNHTFVVH
jgi:hypothetical protein